MKKSALFRILILISVMLPAILFNSSCNSGLFHSEIAPCDGGSAFYQKTNINLRPDVNSSVSVGAGFELKVPAGGVSGPASVSISVSPPPFQSNGTVSYRGDVYSIENANIIRSAIVSLKAPDGYVSADNGQGAAAGPLRALYHFSRGGRVGFAVPEITDGRAVVRLKNVFAAPVTITGGAPSRHFALSAAAATGGSPSDVIYEAGENEGSGLTISLISIDAARSLRAGSFDIYADDASISEGDLSALAAELEKAASYARSNGFKTPSASRAVDVYVTRFVDGSGAPSAGALAIGGRAECFVHKNAVFLSSSPYEWNRSKTYRNASREYFKLCLNEYFFADGDDRFLSDAGWGWFPAASAAWFAASLSEDPMSADGLCDSRSAAALTGPSGGLFTRSDGAGERWYFLWWLSNKYGASKVAELLTDAAELKNFHSSAASLLSPEDFAGYFDSLIERSYGSIFEGARAGTLPHSVRLRPLEASLAVFDATPGKDVEIVKKASSGVKIFARLRAGMASARAVSGSVIFRNASLCEILSSGVVDSILFDKVYIAAFNSEISVSGPERELAALSAIDGVPAAGSYIYPDSSVFDRNVEKRSDISVIVIAAPGDSLASIDNGGYRLVRGEDYANFSSGVIIKADYLAAIASSGATSAVLVFNFTKGGSAFFDISIIDTTPYHSLPKPVAVHLDPAMLTLPHSSKYELSRIRVTVEFEDGSSRQVYSGISWKVKQGAGVITGNIYEPRDEDYEQLECAYAQEGFEPIYGHLSVSYSDGKLVPVLKASFTAANAGETFIFDASGSAGCDLYEWWFDLANIYNGPDESARVKYWSGEAKTSFVYERGGVYRLALKVKNSSNPAYVRSTPVLFISVRPLPPMASPPAGSYEGAATVALSAGSETGRIIYTLDGSVPSPAGNGKVYTSPFKLSASATLRSIAVVEENERTAMIASEVMTARYNIFNNSNIIPSELVFDRSRTPAAEMAVALELNGNTLENLIYRDYILSKDSDYFIADGRLTFAGGFLRSLPDGPASVIFNFSAGESRVLRIEVIETPVYDSSITPTAANFDRGINRADIRVTLMLNGNTLENIVCVDRRLIEGADFTVQEGSITLKKEYLAGLPVGVSKIMFKFSAGADAILSVNVYQSYIIVEPVRPPEFSVPSGVYNETFSVTITSATPGATIRYTLDGSEPSQSNGLTYAGPVPISSSATLKAMAFKAGYINSQTVSCDYTLVLPAAAPEFEPEAGTYYYDQTVSIYSATEGATIKYTLNGTQPSADRGFTYDSPFVITKTTTVKAIALKPGCLDSAVVTAEYIMLPPPQPRVDAPVFSPAAGSYAAAQTVTLSCATEGATIKYTLDGSVPTSKNGAVYKNPITVSLSTVIKAYAYKKFMADSEIVSASYEILPPASAPVFTPAGGTYGPGLSVAIATATEGATIKYTLDGSTPSAANGLTYSEPLTINADTTVKAIAIKAGIRNSEVVTAEYEILPPVADPQFAPAGGTYADPQTVTLSCATEGATIKYTLDGSVPTSKNGTTYRNPFTVSATATVKAIAYKNGLADSNVVTAVYEILPPASAPVFTPAGGTYGPGLSVAIATATEGATIKYTLDGSTPSATNGLVYSEPLTINADTTVKAIAIKAGIRDSEVVTAEYEILPPVAAPSFDPPAGTYSGEQTITLSCATKNATIVYTLDGTTPTRDNGTQYKKAFKLSASATVKAFAYKSGLPDSSVSEAAYVINP